jgi:RimJ/RimL family protein N-acetyltransferase
MPASCAARSTNDRRRRSKYDAPYRAQRRHAKAICMAPYPAEWEHRFSLSDGRTVFVRPIRPEDEQLYARFMAAESLQDLRWRFFAPVKELDRALITRLTHIDYDRAMAFIALDETSGDMLGVARLHQTVPNEIGEYAVIVRSDLKSHGLGWHLMQTMIDYARKRGLRAIQGQVMYDNQTMLDMCAELGFDIRSDPTEPSICNVKLML